MTLDAQLTNTPPAQRSTSGVISIVFGVLASIIGIIAFGLSFEREPDGTYIHSLTPALMVVFLYLPAVLIGFLTAIASSISRKRQRDLLIVAWFLIAAQLAFWGVFLAIHGLSFSYGAPGGF